MNNNNNNNINMNNNNNMNNNIPNLKNNSDIYLNKVSKEQKIIPLNLIDNTINKARHYPPVIRE